MGFLVCGGFSVLLQIALELALLFAFDDVLKQARDRRRAHAHAHCALGSTTERQPPAVQSGAPLL